MFLVEIDPWGNVTQTREVTGDGVSSFVGQYAKPIPYEVIDSDAAVPYWVYTLFDESTADYVSAQIDALTSEVTPPS